MKSSIDLRARRDAEYVRSKALWRGVLRTLRGLPNDLLPFEAVNRLNPSSESYWGVRPIPICQIVGSVDRYKDFDLYFLPRFSIPLDRWIGIRRARLEGLELPAIQVYKVGGIYFVKDGHHRVSVAREEGQTFIDAEVIELNVSVQPDSGDSIKDLIIKGEYAQFLEWTQLKNHEEILFTVPGRYEILLDHIRTHQYYLGENYHREVLWDEAVASWYANLYQPVLMDIRKHRALRRFPGRKEADLYVWIMDHRHYLKQEFGLDFSPEEALQDYSTKYSPRWLIRVWQKISHVYWRKNT